MLETIPVWDSYYTIIQFYSSFIILGLLGLILIISNTNNTLLEGLESTKVINTSLSIILVVLFVSIIFLLIRLWNLKLGGIAELSSFNSITSKNLPLLYARIILAVLAIGLIVLQLFYLRFKHSSYLLLSLAIIMILSEITGRYLFYASYRRVGI
jgi:DMSO reductase anchor subunit